MAVPAHDYRFGSRWRVAATPAEVFDVLADVNSLSRWCPSVYLESRLLHAGDKRQVGAVAEILTRGWIGYRLRFRLTITEVGPHRCAFTASGDLLGRGEWELTPFGRYTLISFQWHVRLEKPLLRRSPAALRPIFAINHDWAMAQGEQALRLELRRRRARDATELAAIPAPPRPPHPERAAIPVTAVVLFLLVRRRKSDGSAVAKGDSQHRGRRGPLRRPARCGRARHG
jgi:Polyketide cyclase / dehydrase and lipid transport